MQLDLLVKLECQRSAIMLSVGIKYSTRDRICDVDIFARAAKMQHGYNINNIIQYKCVLRTALLLAMMSTLNVLQTEISMETGHFLGPEPDPTRSRYTQTRRDPDPMVYVTCRKNMAIKQHETTNVINETLLLQPQTIST